MPRYYFDTYDGDQFLRDEIGIEFDSLDAARSEAQRFLPEMAREALPDKSWLGKFGRRAKWSFCLSAARMAAEQEKR